MNPFVIFKTDIKDACFEENIYNSSEGDRGAAHKSKARCSSCAKFYFIDNRYTAYK